MATSPRPIQRDIFAENNSPSQGFIGRLKMVLFQPRQFFKQNDISKHSLTIALLILALIAYGAVQQAIPASSTPVDSGGVPPMDGGVPPMDGGGVPMDVGGAPTTGSSDPSEAWMVGLSAAGRQAIYWAVLAILLAEVSLFNGKAPEFNKNLAIAIWATVPMALMAGVQILFVMGGGKIGEAGFAGFLDDWEAYVGMPILMQSVVYAFAAQISLFWLWNMGLLYVGGREVLKGKRLAVLLVLVMWITMLVLAFGYQKYQSLESQNPEMPVEIMPEGEMPMEEMFPGEGEMPTEGGESAPNEGEQEQPVAPVRSGGKG